MKLLIIGHSHVASMHRAVARSDQDQVEIINIRHIAGGDTNEAILAQLGAKAAQ
ncbi:hypothetical protein [Shimia isoporae]|nr:hypothetical protein [Shimia isoporae]